MAEVDYDADYQLARQLQDIEDAQRSAPARQVELQHFAADQPAAPYPQDGEVRNS